MIKMKLPSYPLITIDPLFSIWSKTDKLYDSATIMWTDQDKPINGNINIDGVSKRFMGLKGAETIIEQKSVELSMTSTKYTFSDESVKLTVRFSSPFLLDDLKLATCPFGYIDVECESIDNKDHDIQIVIDYSEKLVYERSKKLTRSGILPYPEGRIAYLGRLLQKPLQTAGDFREIDWGFLYVAGNSTVLTSSTKAIKKYYKKNNLKEKKSYKKLLVSEYSGKVTKENKLSFFNIVAYDDISSINYFGSYKKGYWTADYYNIINAVQENCKNHDEIIKRLDEFDNKTEKEVTEKYSKEYLILQIASYRQVLAAHKVIKDADNIIYLSKECGSNGCIGTVDVSYPSVPLFLLKEPRFVKGMLLPVFSFARMNCWNYEFSPHDVGVYPYATGQVYGARPLRNIKSTYLTFIRKFNYKLGANVKIYKTGDQMPVEECGNMLIMSAAYFNESGDYEFIKENSDLLSKWADYLVKEGIVLQYQLCTDDFAGKSEKNVNLAIKSIMGIASWGLLLNKIQKNEGDKYLDIAKSYAKELEKLSDVGTHTTFSIDNRKSWSMKYNLVWDKLFNLNLFTKEMHKKEVELYLQKINRYGVPLDSRSDITKSDWMMWAAALDDSGKLFTAMTKALCDMLSETKTRKPYTDYFNTVTGESTQFVHRTVQGAMWIIEYKDHLKENKGHLFS